MSDRYWRSVHRRIAPLMAVPLVLTLSTGFLFEIAILTDKEKQYDWLMDLHRGNFGPLQLETIYPFLNALGLLVLVATGLSMWWKLRQATRRRA